MRPLVFLILLLVASSALAGELVMKNEANGATLRLADTPCSHGETLALLKEEGRPKFKNARIRDAKGFIQFYGCWLAAGDTVIVILQDGGAMKFQASAFSHPSI
jgi:hypothetical protein